jgi:putative transposase
VAKPAQPRVAVLLGCATRLRCGRVVLESRMMTLSFYRRNLPHWQPDHCSIFVTWRLHGSLPKGFAEHLRKWSSEPGKQFFHADRILDAESNGPLWLNDPGVANEAQRAIRHGAELGHYVLRAYVIMPNHVHVLLDPLVPLEKLTSGIKGVSAREGNARLGGTGKPFWQDESFDHWIRGPGQLARTHNYIENNPVKARLCAEPQDWPWSSTHE